MSYLFLHFFVILDILSNSRTQGESWRFHKIDIWIYFKFEIRINLILLFFSPIISNIKNKWEKIIWFLQIKRNIGERILKSNFICYFIQFRKKTCIFENCILVQKNVHLVLNIRFGRWKLKEICPRGNNKVIIYFLILMINVYYSC